MSERYRERSVWCLQDVEKYASQVGRRGEAGDSDSAGKFKGGGVFSLKRIKIFHVFGINCVDECIEFAVMNAINKQSF